MKTHRQPARSGAQWLGALLLALMLILPAGTAQASVTCPRGTPTRSGCSYQLDRNTVCVWAASIGAAVCIRLGVQP